MKIAEQVTFGGSGLDRAAHLRASWKDISAKKEAIAFWRGKPMFDASKDCLARFSLDHPIFEQATPDALFLGRDAERIVLARDVSAWEPDEMPDSLGAFLDPSEQIHPDAPDTQRFSELRAIMSRLSPRDAELAATARSLIEWHRTHQFCANCGARSEVDQAGWQRNCPQCGRHHFPRTDPVVIMLVTHGNSVLVGRSPGWPEKMFSLLAGFVEPGETIEAAVRRETFEEAGIRVGAVEYLSSQPWSFPSSLMFGCRGYAENRDITLDPAEIEEAVWVTREEMLATFAGETEDRKPARKGAIAHFLIQAWLADRLD